MSKGGGVDRGLIPSPIIRGGGRTGGLSVGISPSETKGPKDMMEQIPTGVDL